METYTFEEKTLDLAKNKALQELGTTEVNIIVK